MRNTKIKTKTEKGITLIALIITIVVLLILAVVAINSIQNDGIISKAQNAADKYNQSVQNEADQLQNYLNYLNEHNGGSENGEGNEQKTYVAYTVGQEVKLKDQSKEAGTFYVLANSDTTQEKVTLITKLGINTDDPENIVQSSSPTSMSFISGGYRIFADVEGMSDGYLFGTDEPDSDFEAAYAAYKYGEQLGCFGRLPNSDELWDFFEEWNGYDYMLIWTGEVYYDNTLYDYPEGEYSEIPWVVEYYFREDMTEPSYMRTDGGYAMDLASTRPVIEISKNLIELY